MNTWGWVAAGSACSFALLSFAVVRHIDWLTTADVAGHAWAVTTRTQSSIPTAHAITQLGSTYVALPAIAAVGYLAMPHHTALRRVGVAALLTAVAGLGAGVGLLINAAINGVRPAEADWLGAAGGPTFPSGHTTMATILAAAAAWAVWTRHGSLPRVVALAAIAVAGLVGLSRWWLGVHWPSDVVGGWLFGLTWAAAAVAIVDEITRFRHRRAGT